MPTIVFIHGMFQNAKSWSQWISFFERAGYHCEAPSWPKHNGEPAHLRATPPLGLGDLALKDVVINMRAFVQTLPEKPVLIGHSVGGLIVQLLAAEGLAAEGVCISSVAPNAMFTFDWGFMKNSLAITNPLKGNEAFLTDVETFHEAFCNTMSMEETRAAFERTAVHDSRNILRDCLGEDGRIDVTRPHAPLLFVGGKEDAIIPIELNEKNAKAYTDPSSAVQFHVFPGRGHFICGQSGWEEVAEYIAEWIANFHPANSAVSQAA